VWLQRIAGDGLAAWSDAQVAAHARNFSRDLAQLGVASADLEDATQRVATALAATLRDARGRWLVEAHAQAASELRLTGVIDGALLDLAIDRTFVDGDGARWIVDYKTGTHEGADVARFLDSEEQRYRPQLERYARLMAALEPARTIRLGLYFPLLREWREWTFAG